MVDRAGPELRQEETYTNSPVVRIIQGERVMRRRIERDDCPIDYPVRAEIKAARVAKPMKVFSVPAS